MEDWQELQDRIMEFANETFPDATISSKLAHLREEIDEVEEDPKDIIEWADCAMLLLNALAMAGYTTSDLYDALNKKLEICRNREWHEPDENGVVRHIKK